MTEIPKKESLKCKPGYPISILGKSFEPDCKLEDKNRTMNVDWNISRTLNEPPTGFKHDIQIKATKEIPCRLCTEGIPSSEEQYNLLKETADWFEQYDTWLKRLIGKKLNLGEIKDQLYVMRDDDPFEHLDQNRWVVRYFGLLCRKLYPPTDAFIRKDGLIEFKHRFHPRALYYRLISTDYCIPVREGRYYVLQRALPDKKSWNNITELLKWARYAGYVPFRQVRDMRSGNEIFSSQMQLETAPELGEEAKTKTVFNLTKEGKTESPKFGLYFQASDFQLGVQAPLIIFITEKGELDYVFEYIATKYLCAYYIGTGFHSISAAQSVYDFIKQHSNYAIVLMVTDYDKAGLTMPHAFFRKLQYISANDKLCIGKNDRRPIITCRHWLVGEDEINELFQLEKMPESKIQFIPKVFRKLGERFYFELDALNLLIGKDLGKFKDGTLHNYSGISTLQELFLKKLELLFPPSELISPKKGEMVYNSTSPLISIEELTKVSKEELMKWKSQIQVEMEKLYEELKPDSKEALSVIKYDPKLTDFDEYGDLLENWLQQQIPVQFIANAIKNSDIELGHIEFDVKNLEKEAYNKFNELTIEVDFKPEVKDNLKTITTQLNVMRNNIDSMLPKVKTYMGEP